jgi:hypothetical protein
MEEPTDPFEGEIYTFRSADENGDVTEIEMTAAQVLDFSAGKAIGYVPRDREVLMDEDGQIIERESAVPPDKAA